MRTTNGYVWMPQRADQSDSDVEINSWFCARARGKVKRRTGYSHSAPLHTTSTFTHCQSRSNQTRVRAERYRTLRRRGSPLMLVSLTSGLSGTRACFCRGRRFGASRRWRGPGIVVPGWGGTRDSASYDTCSYEWISLGSGGTNDEHYS